MEVGVASCYRVEKLGPPSIAEVPDNPPCLKRQGVPMRARFEFGLLDKVSTSHVANDHRADHRCLQSFGKRPYQSRYPRQRRILRHPASAVGQRAHAQARHPHHDIVGPIRAGANDGG